ncbi:hypothetical protein [Microbulbifer rhizosphaerae]|uniref:WD40-like Beta Propeller Repeat n=1 Tax=Microbulbifer rhizosphaerae TaxID=1562603 RepID=A0A7W4WCX9_9GAMM|nr:hypothetical protein [Microbulbifer rhizosphaerae]MBB3061869.1 hypothetical protein [Microbulbifer rhizosphaerae]
MDQYPTLNFITQDPDYSDYRPAVGPDGTVVIFERTAFQSGAPAGDTTLYVVDDLGNPDPLVFIPAGGPGQQTTICWWHLPASPALQAGPRGHTRRPVGKVTPFT